MKQGGRTISLQYTLVPELANYLPHCPKNNINQASNDCIVDATVCTSICFLCRDSDSFLEVKKFIPEEKLRSFFLSGFFGGLYK